MGYEGSVRREPPKVFRHNLIHLFAHAINKLHNERQRDLVALLADDIDLHSFLPPEFDEFETGSK